MGNAIISVEGWRPPKSYRSIPQTLMEQGVLSGDEAAKAEELAGLRNIIVHIYADIDHPRISRELSDMVEWARRIMRSLLRYLEERGIDPPLP